MIASPGVSAIRVSLIVQKYKQKKEIFIYLLGRRWQRSQIKVQEIGNDDDDEEEEGESEASDSPLFGKSIPSFVFQPLSISISI